MEATQAQHDSVPIDFQDFAQESFLNLLRWFRIIILQDAVFLKSKFPHSPLWQHSIFTSPLFENFSQRLYHEAIHGEDPEMVRIKNILPELGSKVDSGFSNIQSRVTLAEQTIRMDMAALKGGHQKLEFKIQPMLDFYELVIKNGGFDWSGHLSVLGLPTMSQSTPTHLSDANVNHSQGRVQTNYSNVQFNTINQSLNQNVLPVATNHLTNNNDPQVPVYHMQSTKLVEQAWKEFDQGVSLNAGAPRGPAIRELDQLWGNAWRRQDPTCKAYSRCKCIWEAIIQISAQFHMDPVELTKKVDKWRVADKTKVVSIPMLNQMLFDVSKGKMDPIWGLDNCMLLEFT